MKIFYYPTKDTTITAVSSSYNFGLDQILEVGKLNVGVKPTRALIQFDLSSISASLSISTGSSYFLNLEIAEAFNLNENQEIYALPVSQSWLEGTGNYLQQTQNAQDGASWNSRSGTVLGLMWTGSSYINTLGVTASISNPAEHIRFDVSNIVRQWLSGSIPNYGLVLKLSDTLETTSGSQTIVKLFSNQTHTIYRPTLELAWNSQSYTTGSLIAASADSLSIGLKNLRSEYSPDVTSLVRLSVRDRFPVKTFSNVFSRYTGNQYLPATSYYSIVDAVSNLPVIPFDEFSKISCDSVGNYFVLSTNGLYPNRPYKIYVKVVRSESRDIFDTGIIFTVKAS